MAVVPDPQEFEVHPGYGFLADNPLTELPAYFSPWTNIAFKLQEYNRDGSLRQRVRELPLLDHSRLGDDVRAWRFAHLILTSMTQCYVWCEGPNQVPEILPRQVAVPLKAVSDHLGVPPFIGYFTGTLCNWKPIESSTHIAPELITPKNVEKIITINAGKAESWFFCSNLEIEIAGFEGIMAIIDAQRNVLKESISLVGENLGKIEASLRNMIGLMGRFREGCSPDTFVNDIMPFLGGWDSPPFQKKKLKGLIFEGVSEEPQTSIGASAAPSPTLPVFDAALGINPFPPKDKRMQKIQLIMPPHQRHFIAAVANGPSIKDFVHRVKDSNCSEMFDRCVQAVADFRSQHIKAVTSYVVAPMAKRAQASGDPIECNAVSEANKGLLEFLKGMRSSQTSGNGHDVDKGSIVTWVLRRACRFITSPSWTRTFLLGALVAVGFTIYWRS